MTTSTAFAILFFWAGGLHGGPAITIMPNMEVCKKAEAALLAAYEAKYAFPGTRSTFCVEVQP